MNKSLALAFSIIAIIFIGSFVLPSYVKADQISESLYFMPRTSLGGEVYGNDEVGHNELVCNRHGQTDTKTCYQYFSMGDQFFHQLYNAQLHLEGHGHQDGSAQISIDICFRNYFGATGFCQSFVNLDPGDWGALSNIHVHGGDNLPRDGTFTIGGDYNGTWTRFDIRTFVRDSEAYITGTLTSRRVSINTVGVSDSNPSVNQNFDVNWNVEDKAATDIEMQHSSNIDCDFDSPTESFNDPASVGSNTCRGVTGGSAWFKLLAWGAKGVEGYGSVEQLYEFEIGGPPGPFNLSATNCYGDGNFDLSWSASENAVDYDIYARAWSNGSWGYRATTNQRNYTIQEAIGTDWYFKVIAKNSSGTTESNVSGGTNCPTPQKTLTVTKDGTGTGTVTSSPAGINCGVTCQANYTQGTQVTLTATPDAGSIFAGWSGGGCSGSGTCVLTLNDNTTVTATFNLDSCARNAQFVSQTINGVAYNSGGSINLSPGTSYPVVITMRNVCDDTWTTAASYKLGSQNPADNTNWGLARDTMDQGSVAKNANATFTFNMTTPGAGVWNFQWRMVQDGVAWFGDSTPNISINVTTCSYSISPTSQSFGSSGGSGSIAVTAAAGCAWTASEALTWVTINTGTSGTGSGTVTYTVSANSGVARSGTMTVAGQTFSITQGAFTAGSITYTITYTPKTLNTPFNATINNSVCQQLTVNWSYTSNGTEDGFTVYRSLDNSSWVAASGLLGTAVRSFTQATPPLATGTRYYYMVRAHRAGGVLPAESANSNSVDAINQPCLGILSGSKYILRVNGVNYTTSTQIKNLDTITYGITISNAGPASVTINFICENPSSNLSNMTALAVSGTGSSSGGITQSDATCVGLGNSGKRLNVSGTQAVGSNWVISFDTTFTTTAPTDPQEAVENRATIYYTDGSGQHPLTVVAPTLLVNTSKAQVPTFREVAP